MADPDYTGLFFGEDDTEGTAQAAALTKALRGQRELGMLAQLSGDKVLSGFGGGLLSRAAEQEQRAAQAPGERLRLRLDQQRLAKGKSELDESTAAANPIYGDLATKFGFKLPAGMTNASAREALALAEKAYAADMRARELNLNREAMRATREDAKATKAADTEAKDVKELAEDADKLGAPGFYQKQSEAAQIAADNPKDLPGFGSIAGRLPDWLVSGEGKALRQSVGQMLAEYRKGVTGSGMSDTERTEFGAITGLLQTGDEDAVRQGITRLQRAMDARVANRAAGSPKAAAKLAEHAPWLRGALERTGGAAGPAHSAPVAARPPLTKTIKGKDGKTRQYTMGPDGWEVDE